MTTPTREGYLRKIREVQFQLSKARDMGSKVDFGLLISKISDANTMAETLGIPQPYPDLLIQEIEGMRDRVEYYNRTGLDAPSLSNAKH